jgi:M6 family metalloprotease-like protein
MSERTYDVRWLAFLLCFFTMLRTDVLGVPAGETSRTVTQPDGVQIELRLRGDEYISWHETIDGYAVIRDEVDGWWKYAVPGTDVAAFQMLDVRVGAATAESLGLTPHDLPAADLLRWLRDPENLVSIAAAQSPPASGLPEPATAIPAEGSSVKNVVILASFSDHWDGSTVSATHGRPSAEYDALFNEVGHSADGATGSVRDYYEEVSYGRLTITSQIVNWVQLPQNQAFYGAGNPDANAEQMVIDAIAAADAAGFDFSQGDSDGDGWVDMLTIIHSGLGQEFTGNSSDAIWSHKASVPMQTVDGVSMSTYHTDPALRSSGTDIIRIGVICHEMGHFFGLPDLYDYSGLTQGVGTWGLMGSGSWGASGNSSTAQRPVHLTAWSKAMLGFVQTTEIHSESAISLPAVETNAVVHLLRDGTSSEEYFLIENRQPVGFDADIADHAIGGILIWHVDRGSANNDLGSWDHPAVKLEEADADNSLASTRSMESGDVWRFEVNPTGGFSDQTGSTTTNAMVYQSGHFSRADDAAYYTYNRLSNFSASAATMTYDAQTLKTTLADQSVQGSSYTLTWPAVTNGTAYEIQQGTPATLTSLSDGAESEEGMLETWHVLGDARRDTAGQVTGNYSYVFQKKDQNTGKFYSNVQQLILKNAFTVTDQTTISLQRASKISADSGYLKLQISADNGSTWTTLDTYAGFLSWGQVTISNGQLLAAVPLNSSCIVRFVFNAERTSGWSTFPSFGTAIDDFEISNTELAGFSGWAMLSDNLADPSFQVTAQSVGQYAYQVRAFANGVWQGFSQVATVDVQAVVPTQLVIDAVADTSVSGSIMTALQIGALDGTGSRLVGVEVTVALATGDGSLSGTLTQTTVDGAVDTAASFADLVYTASADGESFSLILGDGNLSVTTPELTADVVASQFVLVTPAADALAVNGDIVSGSPFATQPVIEAQDGAGARDIDFTGTVTATLGAGSGALAGGAVIDALAGVVPFVDLSYSATADAEAFQLSFDGTLPSVKADLTADVVATRLAFTRQPAPRVDALNATLDLRIDPLVAAVDGAGVLDVDFIDDVTLSATGAGVATLTNNMVTATAGLAAFTGLTLSYTAASHETFDLLADDTISGDEGDVVATTSSPFTFVEASYLGHLSITDTAGGIGVLTHGLATLGTAGLNLELGEQDLGAVPEAGTFDVRFSVGGSNGSLVDLRSADSTSASFVFDVQAGAIDYPLTIGWDPTQLLATGEYRLQNVAPAGTPIDVDMTTQASLALTDPSVTRLQVQYSPAALQSFTYDLPAGWSLISLPLAPADSNLTAIFPDALSLFRFTGSYQQASALSPCEGYWISLGTGGSYAIEGQAPTSCVNNVGSGWSLLGAPLAGTTEADLGQEPAGILLSSFGFSGSYQQSTTYAPGAGYWVNVSQIGTLTFDNTGMPAARPAGIALSPPDFDGGRLWLEDGQGMRQEALLGVPPEQLVALPPAPPAGVLDLRFVAHGLETRQASDELTGAEWPVRLQGTRPLALAWEIPDDGDHWELWQGERWQTLMAEGRLQLNEQDAQDLSLRRVAGRSTPAAFSLGSNYPNPFNPSTTIQYELVDPGLVSLRVYDTTGQLVRQLVAQTQAAGRYQAIWDGLDESGRSVATGLYLYELRAGRLRAVAKMVLMK